MALCSVAGLGGDFVHGVFASAVAYVCYYWLLRYLEASQLSAFTDLLPVLASILGILTLRREGLLNAGAGVRRRLLDRLR